MGDFNVLIYYTETAVWARELAQGVTALTALSVFFVVLRFLSVYRTWDYVAFAALGLLLYVSGTGMRAIIEWLRVIEAARGNRFEADWLVAITVAGAAMTILGGAICVFGFLPHRLRFPVSLIAGAIAVMVPLGLMLIL